MKLIQEKELKNKFEPFELNLLIESEDEARLLYHVFNRARITQKIFSEGYENDNYYIKPRLNQFQGVQDIYDYLEKKVEIYGNDNN